VHELVMWCIFKKLRGYLLFLQMCQLPVSLIAFFPISVNLHGIYRENFLANDGTVGAVEQDEVASPPSNIGEHDVLAWHIHWPKHTV